MVKNYIKHSLLAMGLLLAAPVAAVEFPSVGEAPQNGKSYILISRSNPTQFWSRTSWDGAYYLLPYGDQYKSAAFKAVKNDNGTWSFAVETEEVDEEGTTVTTTTYVGIPVATDNLNGNLDGKAEWTVEESDVPGFYKLKAAQGQGNELTIGGYLHLNSGNQYAVISESTNYWFPDYFGGVQRDEEGQPILADEGYLPIPQNTISQYWAFADAATDFTAYNLKIQLYTQLQDIEENYQSDETYKAGFQNAIDAALPYYQKADFTEDDLNAAKAAIDSYTLLYKEILGAEELLGDQADADFRSAIDAAVKSFNEQGSDLTAAMNTLKAAEQTFAESKGELTILGTNMSFEDLSAQGGNMSSSVAAPPTGWNVYINGKQVTTAQEVTAAGVGGWHGVNNDAEGALDGNYAFGIWVSGVPQYEISQTINNLENGTYIVSASLMVGANGSGSRRTTQRIFGNLNSKYFASEGEYDQSQLDQSEVYGFEGLSEPVTDRLLQEMSVRAFVYDGTLTFGVRTDGNIKAALSETSNGGAGWFKTDNFRIFKVGYVQSDALDVYNHFSEMLFSLSYNKLDHQLANELSALTSGAGIGANSSQEEIVSAILKLKDAYPKALASINLYTSLSEAISRGSSALIDYEYYTGVEEFGDIVMEAEDMYAYATSTEEEINAMIARIDEGIELLKASGVALGDVTYVLKNPGFEDLSAQNGMNSDGVVAPPTGWTLKLNGQAYTAAPTGVGLNWCAINSGDDITRSSEEEGVYDHFVQYTEGTHLWGIWANQMPDVELSQTLTGMPPGTYTLMVDVLVQNNGHDNITTQRIFGNNYVQMYGSQYLYEEAANFPEDAKNASEVTYAEYTCADGDRETDFANPMQVTFGVGEDGILTIGFRTNGLDRNGAQLSNGWGWFKLDNFRLSYDSTEIPTAVKAVSTRPAGKASIFNLSGRRQNALQRGVNIIQSADGTMKKVLY